MKGKKLLSLGGIMILLVIFIILYNHHFLQNLVGNDEIRIYDVKKLQCFIICTNANGYAFENSERES